jgi:hypothetical protein
MSVPESDLIKTELELLFTVRTVYTVSRQAEREEAEAARGTSRQKTGTSRHKHKSLLLVFFYF